VLTPDQARAAALGETLRSTDRQLQTIYNLNAGVQADNDADAAEALARQAEFAEGRASLARPAAAIAHAYDALRGDPRVQAALATLSQAEGQPVVLGPIDDYTTRLQTLDVAMYSTRALTTAPGRSAPDYGAAATLAESAQLELRLALGRLDDRVRRAGATPTAADRKDFETLAASVAAVRTRYVRSASLLREAFDAMGPPPPPVPTPVDPSRIRDLIERQRVALRAAFVASVEKSLRVERVPLEREGEALWVRASINGVANLRLRVDRPAEMAVISEPLAASIGLGPGDTTPGAPLTTPDGRRLAGRRGTLRSLQVGPFVRDQVECFVASDSSTPPSLGRTSLGQLVVRVDTAAEPPTLVLTLVDVPPIMPQPLPPEAFPPKLSNENGRRARP
jgi:hypothetical protein